MRAMLSCLMTTLLVLLATRTPCLLATEAVDCSGDQLELLDTQVSGCVARLQADFLDQVNSLEEDSNIQESSCVLIQNILESCSGLWGGCYTDPEIANLKSIQLQNLKEELKDNLDLESCQVLNVELEQEQNPIDTEADLVDLPELENEDQAEAEEEPIAEIEEEPEDDLLPVDELEEELPAESDENNDIDDDPLDYFDVVTEDTDPNEILDEEEPQTDEDFTDEIVDKVDDDSDDCSNTNTCESETVAEEESGMFGRLLKNIVNLASRN